jgi:hypothetical protein
VFVTDPETGNPVQTTTDVVVQAWMEGNAAVKPEPGQNPNVVNLRGYAVKPRLLPTELIRKQSEASAVYVDPLTGNEQTGKFTLQPQFDGKRPRVTKALARALGSELQGTFEFS